MGTKIKNVNYHGTSTGMESLLLKEGCEHLINQGVYID